MPFKTELNGIYSKIKSICSDLNIICTRSDEISVGSISRGIFEAIFSADIIIADLTFSNPNVFYELGVSHSIGNKTILVTQEDTYPFDISHDYIITYSNTIEGGTTLERELKRLIKHLLEGGTIDNPAQMFLPRSREETKLEELSDLSREILISLAESRKMEIELLLEKAYLIGPKAVESVKKDLDKLDNLIKKILKNS